MFFENRFTSQAEEALRIAHECASALGHGFVGSEHILLALARGKKKSAEALTSAGVTYDKALRAVCRVIGKGTRGSILPQGLTSNARKIVLTAQNIATECRRATIGEEHLLLAILREEKSTAAEILNEFSVDKEKISEMLLGGGEREEDLHRESAAKTQKSPNELKMLRSFGRNMCDLARAGRFDPVIGRESEILKMICILSRRSKNNPILLGDAGVGKTALAEGLAQRIVSGNVPENLIGKKIYSVDISAIVAGTKYRGEFEERVKTMFSEVVRAGDIILFIDEIHTIVGAGAAEGAIDAANILKPALSRRELQIIGATTPEEYRKYIEKDAAMARRFRPVTVEEPGENECIGIIRGLAPKYSAHHGCAISDEAIESAVLLSKRYIPERHLPDKAIDLIDEALSLKKIEASSPPPDMKRLEEELAGVSLKKQIAIRDENFSVAAGLKEKEKEIGAALFREKEKWQKIMDGRNSIGSDDIARAVSEQSGVPFFKVTRGERERLLSIHSELSEKVIGQDAAVASVVRAIRRARCLPTDERRPQGSFLFAGPTGVGKTRLCTALAECLFDDEDRLIRLDMSEFMEKHTVSKLLGAPPGYVGHDEGKTLVDRVRKKPYSVVLFDEIEKAHPDVFNILLQILEDGRLTDSGGKSCDFSNTIVVMTSNIGAEKIGLPSVGFISDGAREDVQKSTILEQIKKTIRPEILGRIDEIVIFRFLAAEDLHKILSGMLEKLNLRAEAGGIRLDVEESAREWIVCEASRAPYGARGLRKLILTHLEDRVSLLRLKKEGQLFLRAFAEDGEIKIEEV